MATTSGTTAFNLEIDEIIQEAYDMLKGEHVTSYDAVSARRSLNLLFIDLQNREIPLGNIKKHTLALTEGTNEYVLPSNVIDVLDTYLIRNNIDTTLRRETLFEYNDISNKELKGRPSLFVVHREKDAPRLFLYPTPENSTDTFVYWSVDKVEDASASYQNVDISTRYQPAIIAGLAYNLSLKRDGITPERVAILKQDFEEKLERATEEDRERSSFFMRPMLRRGY